MRGFWLDGQSEWTEFLAAVEAARLSLHCSISNAWFRGHDHKEYSLTPSILRENALDRRSADTERILKTLDQKDEAQKLLVRKLLPELKQIRKPFGEAYKNKSKDFELLEKNYKNLKFRLETEDKAAAERMVLRKNVEAVHYGERDAFIDFRFRSKTSSENSWEILGEMQHYKVPTRLLDWTESMALACYFALEKHVLSLRKLMKSPENKQCQMDLLKVAAEQTPCLWILNPYSLARRSYGVNVIFDLSLEENHDYYHRFFTRRDWPYEMPVPSYSPWRHPRLAAQQGMFTVHGLKRDPLDKQAADCVCQVVLSEKAAIYGAYHLISFLDINKYIMYRDLDSLGEIIKSRYITPL